MIIRAKVTKHYRDYSIEFSAEQNLIGSKDHQMDLKIHKGLSDRCKILCDEVVAELKPKEMVCHGCRKDS